MKKLILIPTVIALAACGSCTGTSASITAERVCQERGLTKGTPKYDHCVVDETRAAKLERETRSKM